MRRRLFAPALILVLAGCGAAASAGLAPERAAAIEDSVHAFLDAYAARVDSADWEGVARLYARDPRFVWLEDGRVAYPSADSVAAALRSVEEQFVTASLETRDVRVEPLAPGLAAVAFLFDQTLSDHAGAGFGFSGAISALLVDTPDGWRFLQGHTSTTRPR